MGGMFGGGGGGMDPRMLQQFQQQLQGQQKGGPPGGPEGPGGMGGGPNTGGAVFNGGGQPPQGGPLNSFLPPRLQQAVASGGLTQDQAQQRYGQYQRGQLPGQQMQAQLQARPQGPQAGPAAGGPDAQNVANASPGPRPMRPMGQSGGGPGEASGPPGGGGYGGDMQARPINIAQQLGGGGSHWGPNGPEPNVQLQGRPPMGPPGGGGPNPYSGMDDRNMGGPPQPKPMGYGKPGPPQGQGIVAGDMQQGIRKAVAGRLRSIRPVLK